MDADAQSTLLARERTSARPEPERAALTPKGERRRQAILDRSAVLFDELGYHRASLAQIAAAAKMTKANVYHYFPAKHDILFAIHDEWIDDLVANFRRSASAYPDPVELLHSVMRDLLFLMHTRRSHVRVYFEYLRELPPDLQARARAKRDEYEALVEGTVANGVERGEFIRTSPRVATFGLFGMCNWAYQWYRPGGPLTHQQVADELFRIYMGGLAAPQPTSQ